MQKKKYIYIHKKRMYFLKLALIFMSSELFTRISAHRFITPMCVNGYLQTRMERLLLTAVEFCSDLQWPCVRIHLQFSLQLWDRQSLCLHFRRLSYKNSWKSRCLSASKMRKMKLFLAFSFRIMFRSPGNTRLVPNGQEHKRSSNQHL